MSLFRSKKDIEFVKRVNRELIERVIGEKFTLYPFSKEYSESNFYGESKKNIYDSAVELYGLVKWSEDQEVKTSLFGVDIIYNLEIDVLQEMLDTLEVKMHEGDCVCWDSKFFEITKLIQPNQFFGRSDQQVGYKLFCRSMRESNFLPHVSASAEYPKHTDPDLNVARANIGVNFDDLKFPYSGSRNDEI